MIQQEKFIELLEDPSCKQVNAALLYSSLLFLQSMPCTEQIDWETVNKAIIDKWSRSGLVRIKTMAWQLFKGRHLSLGGK